MWKESSEDNAPLKTGLTTGSCATACCVAAANYLLAEQTLEEVSITLPAGKTVDLTISSCDEVAGSVRTTTVKDAGDDPDVTHGATVFVELELIAQPGIFFKAAQGVGTVTREGLELAVGEPAINPVPRKMMTEHLQRIAKDCAYEGGFNVAVGVEQGEQIALKTMNPRLGIVGGLSILGTTGIVRPFSCSAWIASIHQGIDVARANGIEHIAASTGNTSEKTIKQHYGFSEMALIEMGDFAGAVLKHLKKAPVARLSLCGGFGKITKLANGHLDLNSRVSKIDFDHLATVARENGADESLCEKILQANTTMEVLGMCQKENVDIAQTLCQLALDKARSIVTEETVVEIWAVNRQGDVLATAGVTH